MSEKQYLVLDYSKLNKSKKKQLESNVKSNAKFKSDILTNKNDIIIISSSLFDLLQYDIEDLPEKKIIISLVEKNKEGKLKIIIDKTKINEDRYYEIIRKIRF